MEQRKTDVESLTAVKEGSEMSNGSTTATAHSPAGEAGDMGKKDNMDAGEKTHTSDMTKWDWDTDPENPYNWSTKKKWGQVGMASSFAIIA